MALGANDIIIRALTILDERLIDVNVLATTEMSLKDIAEELLLSVSMKVVKELPFELKRLLPTTNYNQTGYSVPGYSTSRKKKVILSVNDSFWELIAIKFPSWDKVVTNYITVDSPEYGVQNNPFTRAGSQNPVVAMSDRGTSRVLECYSIEEGDSETTEIFRYVTVDNLPGSTSFGVLAPALLEPFAKALAAELIFIKDNANKGQMLEDQAQDNVNQHI